MERILLLGGTGAMGQHLTEILARNEQNEVYVTTRRSRKDDRRVHYVQGNAHDLSFLTQILAEGSWDAIVDFMVYNTEEFARRVNLFLKSTKQYVFISSARVFAGSEDRITERSPRLLDVSTDTAYLATDEYALTKARQEDLLRNSGRKNWTIVRPYITFSENRLQLGVYEKGTWLYRALQGRSIVFSRDIASHYTTMTYGKDVAAGIAGLVGNPMAVGEDFNVVTDETHKWSEILDMYLEVLEQNTGCRPIVFYTDQAVNLRFKKAQYQVKYCRLFDRRFDNAKLMAAVPSLRFGAVKSELQGCLQTYLERYADKERAGWRLQAILDKVSGEYARIHEMKDWRSRVIYCVYRYMPWWVLVRLP